MNELFIKELVDIKEKLLWEKDHAEKPNIHKLVFLIKEGLRRNVSLDNDKVVYKFQFDFSNNTYLALSDNDTTKDIMISLNGNVDEQELIDLCEEEGIKILKNYIDTENKICIYNFIVNTNYKRVLK